MALARSCDDAPPNPCMHGRGGSAPSRSRARTKRILLRLVACSVAVLGAWDSAVACSIVKGPLTGSPVDSTMWAISGVVGGYTVAAGVVWGVSGAPGLSVAIGAPVMPADASGTIEVYPLGTGSDCNPVAREEADLHAQYPVGSVITVVASLVVPSQASSSLSIVLATQADEFGHVVRVPAVVPCTPQGLLDFRAFRAQYEVQPPGEELSHAIAWRGAHRRWFEDFELVRCLTVLERSSVGSEEAALLCNIAAYGPPGQGVARSLYQDLVRVAHLPAGQRLRLMADFSGNHLVGSGAR